MSSLQGDPDANTMDELVTALGADIEFYQCFRLTDEEFVK
jgi:hypothetical protein